MVRAGGQELGLLPRRPGSGDAHTVFGFHNFNRRQTHAAARGSEEDEIAFCGLAVHDERTIGGEVLHPDGGRFFPG